MMGLRKQSIYVKFAVILLLAIGLTTAAGYVAANNLRLFLMRSSAQAVVEQVIAFRSWISATGMVWVDNLNKQDADYLSSAQCGKTVFYSKNPALATRELSNIVKRSSANTTFRVTSDNFRNPANVPDGFESGAIFAFKMNAAEPADRQKRYIESIEGSRYRYAVPIRIEERCLRCHGDAAAAPTEVVERYGEFRAFGYKVGDIRGIISVEMPAVSLLSASPMLNPLSIGLVLTAFLLNLFLLKKVILDRVTSMTAATGKLIQGKADRKAFEDHRQNSRDEIDGLCDTLDQLQRKVLADADAKKREAP